MKIWLDDERPIPTDFTHHVKTAQEAITLLLSGSVELISLDHDLGDEFKSGNGYIVAAFIEQAAFEGELEPLEVRIHTANSAARPKMEAAIRNARRFWSERG